MHRDRFSRGAGMRGSRRDPHVSLYQTILIEKKVKKKRVTIAERLDEFDDLQSFFHIN